MSPDRPTRSPAPGKGRTGRPSLGVNPLDALDGGPTAAPEPAAPVAAPAQAPRGSAKERKTFYVPSALYAELRGAADVLRDKPHRLTMTDLVEEALIAGIERLRDRYNDGKPFEPVWENLPGGRPLGR